MIWNSLIKSGFTRNCLMTFNYSWSKIQTQDLGHKALDDLVLIYFSKLILAILLFNLFSFYIFKNVFFLQIFVFILFLNLWKHCKNSTGIPNIPFPSFTHCFYFAPFGLYSLGGSFSVSLSLCSCAHTHIHVVFFPEL